MHKTKGPVGVAPTLEHYKRAVMAAVDQNLFVGGRHFYAVEIRRRGPNKTNMWWPMHMREGKKLAVLILFDFVQFVGPFWV
jgi:hypothetical protein